MLASCGADRRVRIWDLTKVETGHDFVGSNDDGPAELLFIHGGHNDKISDLSWNPKDHWLVASVSDDNILQIWRMGDNIHRAQ